MELLAAEGSFQKTTGLKPVDALNFTDTEPYAKRLERYQQEAGRPDAIVGGRCAIGSVPSVLLV
ncbi:hypothetical protein OFM36_38255, partial [Escherichia coli]|nr:hypothetical protein [Escherichia coli]